MSVIVVGGDDDGCGKLVREGLVVSGGSVGEGRIVVVGGGNDCGEYCVRW